MLKLVALVAVFVSHVLAAPPQTYVDHPMLDGRIVGGTATTIEEYPFIASLLRSNSHICGAVIISELWLITAAHCVTSGSVSSYSVRGGSTTRNSGGQVVAVTRILGHANYDSRTTDYDVAALQIASAFTIANAVPIGIVSSGIGPPAGAITTILGWGALSEGGAAATVLQRVEVPIVSQSDCRIAYGETRVTDRMFCAGLLGVGGIDACQGDSGGPAVVNGLVAGLVSWGAGCARPNHPGVKTNLYNLRNWIDGAISTTAKSADVIEY